jgi:hypothetical protein
MQLKFFLGIYFAKNDLKYRSFELEQPEFKIRLAQNPPFPSIGKGFQADPKVCTVVCTGIRIKRCLL